MIKMLRQNVFQEKYILYKIKLMDLKGTIRCMNYQQIELLTMTMYKYMLQEKK